MAATTHVLSAIDNAGYFEGDCSNYNPLRDEMVHPPIAIARDGTTAPNDGPGLGIEINEDFIAKHPGVAGPGYV